MNLKRLSNKELRILSKEISNYGFPVKKGDEVYSTILEGLKIYIINKKVGFFCFKEKIVPSLHIMLENKNILDLMKKIFVDKGAIIAVVKGADVMRPGIVSFSDDLKRGDVVAILDENNKQVLAIGEMLFNSEEIKGMNSGRIAKNIHHYNDKIWNFKI
ncbi:MAG: PUA domain-containing protein [Candidatus Woesearchaeota archaeon]